MKPTLSGEILRKLIHIFSIIVPLAYFFFIKDKILMTIILIILTLIALLVEHARLNPKNNIPVLKNVNGKIYNSEIDLNAQAELVYENGVRSEISVSINENLNNTTTIFGSTGKLIILNPWLPGKESIVEIHKNNQIEKIKTKSDLSVFASQIDCFNKNIEKRNLECDYPSMSIDNSVDCMQIITDWKNKIFENENKKFKK